MIQHECGGLIVDFELNVAWNLDLDLGLRTLSNDELESEAEFAYELALAFRIA